MDLTATGILVLIVTALFVWCLPRHAKTRRFVGTEFEPYVAVSVVAGVALGAYMIFSGLTR